MGGVLAQKKHNEKDLIQNHPYLFEQYLNTLPFGKVGFIIVYIFIYILK